PGLPAGRFHGASIADIRRPALSCRRAAKPGQPWVPAGRTEKLVVDVDCRFPDATVVVTSYFPSRAFAGKVMGSAELYVPVWRVISTVGFATSSPSRRTSRISRTGTAWSDGFEMV